MDASDSYVDKYLAETHEEQDGFGKKTVFEDILKNLHKVAILKFDEKESEVTRFDAKIIYNNNVIDLQVYDNLSPNRWFNLPSESYLDSTEYQIIVEINFVGKKRSIINLIQRQKSVLFQLMCSAYNSNWHVTIHDSSHRDKTKFAA